MGDTEPGTFRRMLRKLTSDVEVLDADDLSEGAQRSGAQSADPSACPGTTIAWIKPRPAPCAP